MKRSILFIVGKLSKKTLYSLVLIFLISSCAILRQRNSLTGTEWIYSDNDWTYEIRFDKNGKLWTTHPNDDTEGNDYWKQKDNKTVEFSYSDRYSVYDGKLIGRDTIVGTGRNHTDSWEYQMIRKQ